MKSLNQLILLLATFSLNILPSCSDDKGEGPSTPIVNAVSITDISNFGDGRDLEVTFSKVSDESLITGYRIIAVKSQNATAFTISIAEGLANDRFTLATANNTNKKLTLAQDAKDSDGELIVEGQPFTVFILTEGESGKNELSNASNSLELTLPDTPATSAPVISDISNFGDGRDIRVMFNKVSDETLITEYRVIVVKAASATSFNLAAAESLPVANYTIVTKTGSNQNITLSQTTKDSDGDLIAQNNQCKAFVLSTGAGRNAAQNELSASSNALTVEIPAAPAVTSLSVLDVANNANGKDMEVKFNKVSNEGMIASYRAIVVKESAAASFNLTAAEALTSDSYVTIAKSGSNIVQELMADLLDSDGDAIQESMAYKIFVLSVADGTLAGKNSLSNASSSITLMQKNAVRTFAVFSNAGTGGMQVDADGNVYMGDFGLTTTSPGPVVYKITPEGNSSVFVTGMQSADGNDFDSQGNFYSVSWAANQIIKVTPSGTRSVFSSGGVINGPIGIAVDASDNLFVTCYNNNTLLKITPAGVASVFSNSPLFNGPNGIDTDAAGNIYVSNYNNANILKVNKDNGTAELFTSTPNSTNAHLVIKNDVIYVAGRSHHKIYKVTLSKVVSDFLGGAAGGQNGLLTTATIQWPNDIAFNADGTKMYVSVVSATTTDPNQFGPAVIKEISIVE